MADITIAIPDNLKEQIEEFKDINWSEVSREAISKKIKRLQLLKKLDKLLENSELTEEDALRLGDEIKKQAWKKYKKEGW